MDEIIKTTLIGMFFGTFGTTIGGILGVCIHKHTNRFLSFILEFAAGLMMAVICFELIPDAMAISNITMIIIGILLGVLAMLLCDHIVNYKFAKKDVQKQSIKNGKKQDTIYNSNKVNKTNEINNKRKSTNNTINSLLKTGIIVGIGLSIHNFPEGLAIRFRI